MNIIDLLRKGNQELFHSSMIAWLLDSNAREHGLGTQFITALADLAGERNGNSELRKLLDSSDEGPRILTESPIHRGRYDIAIQFQTEQGSACVIIENKTKSVGQESQLEHYRKQPNVHSVIGLGLTDVSFASIPAEDYPIILYSDILEILKALPRATDPDFQVLLDHYAVFLEGELSLFDAVARLGEYEGDRRCDIVNEAIDRRDALLSQNDVRFLNLFFLERFLRCINDSGSRLRPRSNWESNKNMASGVWIADYNLKREPNQWVDWISNLARQGASFWVHVELLHGVAARADEPVGRIQLRCSNARNRDALLNTFREHCPTDAGTEIRTRAISPQSDTFYVACRLLEKTDLPFRKLEPLILGFLKPFVAVG